MSYNPALGGPAVIRSVRIGTATGGRGFSGIAAAVLTTPRPPGPLGHPVAKGVVALAAAGELVADKLPRTPSRLSPPGLMARLVNGALSAGLLARRAGDDPIPHMAIGALAALAGAVRGHRFRARLAARLHSDIPGALVEDAAVTTLAWRTCLAAPVADDLTPVVEVIELPA
jgi:uncharacterized membrane protein